MKDREERDVHDFLTVSELDNFNDKVSAIVNKDDKKDTPQSSEIDIENEPTNQESFIVNPSELDEDLRYQLADIIDGKTHFNEDDIKEEKAKGPTTSDNILNSLAVAYITEDNLPIAVALLKDPTVENHKFIIPCDYYELKSGASLEERIQQEFFAFRPDKYNQKLGMELKKTLMEDSSELFIITSSTDKSTNAYLTQCGYKVASTFDTEWEKNPVNLWIN